MALLNKEEFAAMCSTTVPILNTNISRGKIIYDKKEKIIDSSDPLNAKFFKEYQKLAKAKAVKSKPATKLEGEISELYDKVVEKVKPEVEKIEPTTKGKRQREKSQDAVDLSERKLMADIELQEARAEKEKMQLEKLAGKLIPIDLNYTIINIHNNSIFATFQNDVDNLASVFCDILAGGDRKKLAEISQKLSEKLEDCVKRAKDVSLSSVRNAIEEYAETRSRGEKK